MSSRPLVRERPRRRWLAPCALVAGLLSLVGAGCNRPPATTPKAAVQVTLEQDDSPKLALDLFHQAQELPQFREALAQANAHLLRRPGKTLDEASRKRVQSLFAPDAAEWNELEAGSVQPLDAAYLENCFLFRDAARWLEVPGLPPAEQAALGFAWVMRRVLLHEQHDHGLPPHWLLKRGYGGVRDRAAVFLELCRQMRLDGCILELGTKDGPARVVVGVLLPKKEGADLALFDPRLGMPIRNGKGEPATWAEVRTEPELLKGHGVTAEQLKSATARLATPLAALAPRMAALEEMIGTQEHVTLHQDLGNLENKLSAVGLTLAPWAAESVPAPPRSLRHSYPLDNGGVDKSGRLLRFRLFQTPMPVVIYKLEQMHLFKDLPGEAREYLTALGEKIFDIYYLQPRNDRLRGRQEAALTRVDRIGTVLEQAASAVPIAEETFQKQIADWRERVRETYLSGDTQKKQAIWQEDPYVVALLQPESPLLPQPRDRKTLAHILLRACREPLANQVEALRAQVWEDRAARLQAQADQRQREGRAPGKSDVASAWKNARSAWTSFVDRADVPPAQVSSRLAPAAALWGQGQVERQFALGIAEQVHLDLHRALEARLALAFANRRLGQNAQAQSGLTKLHGDLAALGKLEPPRKLLEACLQQARAEGSASAEAERLEMLLRDWTPDGHLAAVRQRVEFLLQAWK